MPRLGSVALVSSIVATDAGRFARSRPSPVIATRTAQGAILVAALVEDEAAEALVHVRRRAVDGERSKAIRKPSEP